MLSFLFVFKERYLYHFFRAAMMPWSIGCFQLVQFGRKKCTRTPFCSNGPSKWPAELSRRCKTGLLECFILHRTTSCRYLSQSMIFFDSCKWQATFFHEYKQDLHICQLIYMKACVYQLHWHKPSRKHNPWIPCYLEMFSHLHEAYWVIFAWYVVCLSVSEP